MYYEIIVAKHGYHLFATAERSATSAPKAKLLYEELKSRFSEEEGYTVTITKWENRGKLISPEDLNW
jgi:hypothetical protein